MIQANHERTLLVSMDYSESDIYVYAFQIRRVFFGIAPRKIHTEILREI